jgi:hypothetical protein
MSRSRIEKPVKNAVAYTENPNLEPAAAASILCGAGEFYVLRNEPAKANDNFNLAHAKLSKPPDPKAKPDADHDVVLMELALKVIDLAGMQPDGQNPIDWPDIHKRLVNILKLISSVEAKQTAILEVGMKLMDKQKGEFAVALAKQLADDDGDKEKKSPLRAQQIAFLVATGQKAEAEKVGRGDIAAGKVPEKIEVPAKIEEKKDADDKDKTDQKDDTADKEKGEKKVAAPVIIEEFDPIVEFGQAEGKALEGEFAKARQLAKHKGQPLDRLEAAIAVAAVAAKKNTAEAKASAQEAFDAYKSQDKTMIPVWLAIQLTRVCARAGLAAEAKQVADGLTEPAEKALAQLELILPQIENAAGPVPIAVLDDFSAFKSTLAYELALERVARHNTRLGKSAEIKALLDSLSEAQQTFVHIGMALGDAEANK